MAETFYIMPIFGPLTGVDDFYEMETATCWEDGEVIGDGSSKKKLIESNIFEIKGNLDDGIFEFEPWTIDNSATRDPIFQWRGKYLALSDVLSNPNNYQYLYYESSKWLRNKVGGLDSGSNFTTYSKPSALNWVAKHDRLDGDTELFFIAESIDTFDDVATFYSLPVAYPDSLETELTNKFWKHRFKSYDLNGDGEGNFVALVIGSVIFDNTNTAIATRFYSVVRTVETWVED
jgi:hypothetical protein